MDDGINEQFARLQREIAQLETGLEVVSGIPAAVEALRGQIAACRAQIAALSLAAPAAELEMQASDNATIAGSPQTVAGGDVRDSALGQGNLVLHHIQIEAGGTLAIGALAAELPPDSTTVRSALTSYLQTLIERYRLMNLQGLGASEAHRLQITIQAVFINLLTDQKPLAHLFGREHINEAQRLDLTRLSTEERSWLSELLTGDELARLRASVNDAGSRRDRPPVARPDDSDAEALLRRVAGPRTALELARHHRALVLLGDPGSGKTTILHYLVLGFAAARLYAGTSDAMPLGPPLAWTGRLPLPILVQLRRFASGLAEAPTGAEPLLRHLEVVLSNDRLRPLARYLETVLERGEALVLLDGLDEIADDRRRLWVVQAIGMFQTRFPHSRIVVTCREYAYHQPYILPAPFVAARVQPLDRGEQDAFLRRWYHAAFASGAELSADACAAEAERRAQYLCGALDARLRLRELTINPLLLTMVVLLNWKRTTLPQQRAELYAECLNVLLEQWEQRRAEGEPAGLAAALGVAGKLSDTGSRLALIQPVAYELQCAGREEARQAEVTHWLLPRFLDLADDDGKRARALIAQFLDFLEGRSGLLIARDLKDRYTFPHKTFQEYLTARELVYRGGDELRRHVVAERRNPIWREVILLAVGHLVASGQPFQARQIAWELLDADGEGTDAFWHSAALAGEIVDELRGNLGADGRRLREETIRRLRDLVESGRLAAPERVAAARTLDHLGDPRALFPERPGFWCAVSRGTFWFGDDREEKLAQVELSYDFQISRFLVTNILFGQFLDAQGGAYDPDSPWWTEQGRAFLAPGGHEWDNQAEPITLPRYWHDQDYNQPNQPVVGVSWCEAAAFCAWLTERERAAGRIGANDTIRLPTSLEWERAARGEDRRRFPWGDDAPTPEHANYDATQIGAPTPVGCFPRGVSPCGALDMAGNVMEWLATPYQQERQVEAGKDFTLESSVLLTYSSFYDNLEHMCCGARNWNYPDYRNNNQGIRVILSLARTE